MDGVTLALAGDVMLGRVVNDEIRRRGFAWPWGDLGPVLREADLFLINLECALTRETRCWQPASGYKPFHFRADPDVVATLESGRVDFASLANNHIGDFGTAGLLETLAVLDRAGIGRAGAGRDLAEARAPVRLAAGGLGVSVVAFADHPVDWAATATSPGINYTPVSLDPAEFAAVEHAIAEARRGADLVVVSMHWGPNMRPRPTPEFRAFAARVVDAGADIFWGHSAHVVQGIEVLDGRLVLYDTGDFVDDYAVDPGLRNDLSALFLVRVGSAGLERLEIVPVFIDEMRVNLAPEPEGAWFSRRLRELSAELGTELLSEGSRLVLPLCRGPVTGPVRPP